MNLEHCRKEAKRLARAAAAGDSRACARAEAVLGERARGRFGLSDAQHVVAVERGYRTWRELRDALGQAQVADAGEARSEIAVETGLEYRPGDRVRLVVVRRPHRVTVSDEARALERADLATPWRELADRLERELDVNISRRGAVWLPVVRAGPGVEAIVARIGRASLTFYQDLVDLE